MHGPRASTPRCIQGRTATALGPYVSFLWSASNLRQPRAPRSTHQHSLVGAEEPNDALATRYDPMQWSSLSLQKGLSLANSHLHEGPASIQTVYGLLGQADLAMPSKGGCQRIPGPCLRLWDIAQHSCSVSRQLRPFCSWAHSYEYPLHRNKLAHSCLIRDF